MSKKKEPVKEPVKVNTWDSRNLNVDELEFEEVTITINGTDYIMKDFTPKLRRVLIQLDAKVKDGDLDAQCEQITLLTDAPPEVLENIGQSALTEISMFLAYWINEKCKKKTK